MYLSLDTCPKFIHYCHLPFAYDDKLQQFARRCVRVYEDVDERPKIMYENNLFEQIYKDGQNTLGTDKIDALIEWGYKTLFDHKIENTYRTWWGDYLLPLIKKTGLSLGEETKLPNSSLITLKTIIQKYHTKNKEMDMPFFEIEVQEQSEWDKKVDYLYKMPHYQDIIPYHPDELCLSVLDWPAVLISILNEIDAWHEITQTLGTNDLQTLQTWMIQRAKSSKYKNWEKWLDFELIKQHQIEFFSQNLG